MTQSNESPSGPEQVLLPTAAGGAGVVELFVEYPDEPGPKPAVLMVHGHQIGDRLGGAALVQSGQLRRQAGLGYIAAAVSQPGYGASEGPPDFCGPRTQAAIRMALDHLRSLESVDDGRIALYGVSRGANASAMVAVEEPDLAAIVLVGGMYDLKATFPTGLPELDENILKESGLSEEAATVRSALRHAHRIRMPVLFVHGALDDRSTVEQVSEFAAILRNNGVFVREAIYADKDHFVGRENIDRAMEPFLARVLGEPPQVNR